MPEPRVIFVNRVYWPSTAATAQLLTDLAEVLAVRGWPVHVIATGSGESGPRNGVTLHRTGAGEQHGGLLSRALNYLRFQRAARRELGSVSRPGDIVVLMTDPPLLATAGGGCPRGTSVVQWIQDIYPEIVFAHTGAWSRPFLWPFQIVRNRAWRSADRCLPVSTDMRATVLAGGAVPASVVVMPNWAPPELEALPDPAVVKVLRDSWGVTGKFVVAYSGNLGRVHEFSSPLAAAERLRANPEIVFLFIGEGARFAEVRAAAGKRELLNVRFLPPQPRERLAAALAAADAHFVTLRPGFERLVSPSKLAGILAVGRPALFVGPAGSELAALLTREQAGRCFSPGEDQALAEAIVELARNAELREKMGRSARECHGRHFTFGAAVVRWEELLRAVAGRHR